MATPKEPTQDERLGAAVVTTVLQCNARFIDNGLSKCTTPIIDYELELPNGEHASLEISRITGQSAAVGTILKVSTRQQTRYCNKVHVEA